MKKQTASLLFQHEIISTCRGYFTVLAFQQCVTDSFRTMISYWKHSLLQRDRLLVSATDCPHQRGHVFLSIGKIVPLCKGSLTLKSPRFKFIGLF
ncbi:hypothetical protein U0070_019884 [Myodes glareolus]|uniref:Uncharacterized protein n=1 Tax=Myodes glareolus TaxID=447135 RepID=A0AAW0JJC6_MYOGA